jgi:protein TonB
MSPTPSKNSTARNVTRTRILAGVMSAAAALLASCRSSTPSPPAETSAGNESAPATVTGPVEATEGSARISAATTERAYRKDGATHLYGLNAHRIYKGQLPPLLYAVGTLQVFLDSTGRVTGLHWMRKPSHAPEVVAEIERTVRAASPFPAPEGIGKKKVTYTDTWLWDKSGKFQLDTLTEGQL